MNLPFGFAWNDVEMMARLLLAVLCGAVVGQQREHAYKPAGLRTHILVALGSALFTIVSFQGFGDRADPSRVAAQIVVGIGFIGAGTILHSEMTVTGITTAATIWIAAALGMAAGIGMYVLTIFTTIVVLLVLQLQKHHETHEQDIATQAAAGERRLGVFGKRGT